MIVDVILLDWKCTCTSTGSLFEDEPIENILNSHVVLRNLIDVIKNSTEFLQDVELELLKLPGENDLSREKTSSRFVQMQSGKLLVFFFVVVIVSFRGYVRAVLNT